MKVTTSLPESRSTESASSASYYLKGAAVIIGTGAAYAVAKATGVWSWMWSSLGVMVAEDKALQTASSSAVQVREGGDPLHTETLSSKAELLRVEELDSLELVELNQKPDHEAAIGIGFFAFKFWMNNRATKYLQNAGAAATDKDYQKQVIQPIAKRILEHVKITGFLDYVSDQTLKDAYAAIVLLVRECADKGVEVDLRKLSDASQTVLLTTIADKTRKALVPPAACCSLTRASRFFRPEITPSQITDKTEEIATAVKAATRRQSIVIPKDPEIKESDTHESKAIVKGKLRSDDSSEIELDVMTEQAGEGTERAAVSSPRLSKAAFLPAIQSRLSSIETSMQSFGSRLQALESSRMSVS